MLEKHFLLCCLSTMTSNFTKTCDTLKMFFCEFLCALSSNKQKETLQSVNFIRNLGSIGNNLHLFWGGVNEKINGPAVNFFFTKSGPSYRLLICLFLVNKHYDKEIPCYLLDSVGLIAFHVFKHF